MTTGNDLSLTISRASFEEPDSSGETSLRGCLNLASSGSHRYEFFVIQQVLRRVDGAILSVDNSEHEDFLCGGETLSLDFSFPYIQAKTLGSSPHVRLKTEVIGCAAAYGQFDPIKLNEGNPGLYGLSNSFTLGGQDLKIESISAAVAPADEEGDVRLEIRALVHNNSSTFIPRLALKGRAIANGGREIDSQSAEEAIGPWEKKILEFSFYSIKQNRIRDLAISTEMTAFKAVSRLDVEHEIQTRI